MNEEQCRQYLAMLEADVAGASPAKKQTRWYLDRVREIEATRVTVERMTAARRAMAELN